MTRSATLPPMSEKAFQSSVERLARMYGWLCYHTRRSDRSVPGFPDNCMVKPGRLIFAELKRDGKKPTRAQQQWLDTLATVPGIETYCWFPSDLQEIAEILAR